MASKGGLGALLKNKQKAKRVAVKEEDLVGKAEITVADVMGLQQASTKFLVKPSANVFGIDFVAFKLRDMDHNMELFSVEKPEGVPTEKPNDDYEDKTGRHVDYTFSSKFLELQNVGATVTFEVGDEPVKDFQMIERHFFKDKLLKSFDFSFGFCIPGSTNTCEHIYEFPTLSQKEITEMINAPGESKSDSFYFVDGKLIMHNRAMYTYTDGTAQ